MDNKTDKFNLICDTINSGIFVITDDLTVSFWNQWLEDCTNIKANNIEGKSILEFYPDLNIKSFQRKTKTTLRLQAPTFFNTSKEGYLLKIKLNNITQNVFKYMQQNITILPYNLDKKEVIVYIYDNTQLSSVNYQLKKAKESLEIKNQILKEQNLEFEQLLNSTMEGLGVSDNNHRYVNVNDIALNLLGYESKDELIGKHILDFVKKEYHKDIKEKILKEYTKPYEIELIKKNGDTFPALVSGKSININNIPHRISAIIDITELREKDKHIFEQAKLVSMGEMIGNIAHQWRQPLSVISTAATGMLMQKEYGILNDETFNKSCQDINEHAQYLSTTIDDFKNFIKGDREKSIFKLTESINEFLNLMESTIKEFNINIILNLQDDINIEGYPNELKQCIINIFNNAKDVLLDLKEEKIYIFITSYTKDNNIIIKIKDNGGGIPLDILPKIFEPYFTTKHQSDGTGLGLHMSYKLITNGMGGKLKAKNITYLYNDIQYTGAEFTISLPLH